MSSWTDIRSAWSSGWSALQNEGLRLYEAAIQANPVRFLPQVQAFQTELAHTRSALDSVRAKLPSPPVSAEDQATLATYQALEQRYHDLAAGLYADAHPAQEEVGIAPLVVAGLVIGAAGIAWSIAAYEYAVNLREQTALADRELAARVQASREGRALPPSTVAPTATPEPSTGGGSWMLLGGLALVAGVLAVPVFLPKRGASA